MTTHHHEYAAEQPEQFARYPYTDKSPTSEPKQIFDQNWVEGLKNRDPQSLIDEAFQHRYDAGLNHMAVARCWEAYQFALEAAKSQKISKAASLRAAEVAFRRAIPPLINNSINDFIACVTYGMLMEIIDTATGSKFLYAAQVARHHR